MGKITAVLYFTWIILIKCGGELTGIILTQYFIFQLIYFQSKKIPLFNIFCHLFFYLENHQILSNIYTVNEYQVLSDIKLNWYRIKWFVWLRNCLHYNYKNETFTDSVIFAAVLKIHCHCAENQVTLRWAVLTWRFLV